MLHTDMRFESWAGYPDRFIVTFITALVPHGLSPSHLQISKGKCKIVPVHAIKHVGTVEVWRHEFLTLALYGGKSLVKTVEV